VSVHGRNNFAFRKERSDLGGGYAANVSDTVAIHFATLRAAATAPRYASAHSTRR